MSTVTQLPDPGEVEPEELDEMFAKGAPKAIGSRWKRFKTILQLSLMDVHTALLARYWWNDADKDIPCGAVEGLDELLPEYSFKAVVWYIISSPEDVQHAHIHKRNQTSGYRHGKIISL
jgi:hypothetical protein